MLFNATSLLKKTLQVKKLLNFDGCSAFASHMRGERQRWTLEAFWTEVEIKVTSNRTCAWMCGGCLCQDELFLWGVSRIQKIHLLDLLSPPVLLAMAFLLPFHHVIYIMGNFSAFSISFSLPCWKLMKNFYTVEILAFPSFTWLIRSHYEFCGEMCSSMERIYCVIHFCYLTSRLAPKYSSFLIAASLNNTKRINRGTHFRSISYHWQIFHSE